MINEQIQQISNEFRLDYLAELRSGDSSSGHGHFVISAEFRATKRALIGEVLITGMVSEANHESPYQYHLLPLLHMQIPLVMRTEATGKFSEVAESFSQLETRAISELKKMGTHLAELALVSRKAGGLKSVRIASPESEADGRSPSERDVRGIRQLRRFETARAHAQSHFSIRETPVEGDQIQIGKQVRFSFAELRFANLYTLARALGVKEISPKIFSKDGVTQTEEVRLQMGSNPQNELTVLVARLKRAGVIPE